MPHTAFQDEAYSFLSDYKHRRFPEAGDGMWRGHSYGHIFAKEDAHKNLLISEDPRFSVIESGAGSRISIDGQRPFSLHRDWAHLNSSQILCINFFYNFLSDTAKLTAFAGLIGIDAVPLRGEFEFDPGDGSSIDFVVHFENGSHLFCEIKYSESSFGSADTGRYGRDFYLQRKKRFYAAADIADDNYFRHYQIVRNICLASCGSHTLFLYPARNKSVSDDLSRGLNAVSNASSFAFHRLTWEELLRAIPNSAVEEKYFPCMHPITDSPA